MFQKHIETDFIRFESSFAQVIFGFESLSKQSLSDTFVDVRFVQLQQVHSDKMVSVNTAADEPQQADAHFTTQPMTAPLIQTADCVPVMIVSSEVALSIHAGWRGIASNLIGKSLVELGSLGFSINHCYAFVGPHILKQSFEVDTTVGGTLLNSYLQCGGNESNKVLLNHPNPNKKYVDLSKIVHQQLIHNNINANHIVYTSIDTFTDHRFHSYRKNKCKGRQWSFCFLK